MNNKPNNGKVVYFVRHGESRDGSLPIFQSLDSPLSVNGRKQADKIAKRIAKLDFSALVSSPIVRAFETAESISRLTDITTELSDLFVESIKPAVIYGKPYADKDINALCAEWGKSTYTPGMRVKDSENFDDLIARADKALDYLINHKSSSIVVVTHEYFLNLIVSRAIFGRKLSGELYKNMQNVLSIENTGLTVLKYLQDKDGKYSWRLWTFNDHAHLVD